MALEPTVNYISDLNSDWPTDTDQVKVGAQHFRNTKRAIKQTFPNVTGPVTYSDGELNQLRSNISNTSTLVTITKPIDMQAQKITNLPTPNLPTDAANKTYVDTNFANINDARLNTLEGKTGGNVIGQIKGVIDSGTNTPDIDGGKFISGYSGYLTPHYSYFTHRYDTNFGSYAYIAMVPGVQNSTQFFRFLSDGRFETPRLQVDGRSDFNADVHMGTTLAVAGAASFTGGLTASHVTATTSNIDSLTAGYLGSTGGLAVNGTASIHDLGITTTLTVAGVATLNGGLSTTSITAGSASFTAGVNAAYLGSTGNLAVNGTANIGSLGVTNTLSVAGATNLSGGLTTNTITAGNINSNGKVDVTGADGIVSTKGAFGTGGNTVFLGDRLTPANQGMHLDWNLAGTGGAGAITVNRGQGGGGLIFPMHSANGTEEGRITFTQQGGISCNSVTSTGNVIAGGATYFTTGNVTGNSWISGNTTDLVNFLSKSYAPISDRRLKKDITPIKTEDAIKEVKSWKTYDYEYVYGKKGHGIIADEVDQKYVSEIGHELEGISDAKQVDQLGMLMGNVPPVLQYLLDKVEKLEAEISVLKGGK